MVETLFTARKDLCGDCIISYSDIVYRPTVLQTLMEAPSPISVVVDLKWREFWDSRLSDPLADAETMKINETGCITELGKKATSYGDIQGQYIGLVKFSSEILPEVV